MPKWLNPVLHATQSTALVGLMVALAATGKVSWAVAGTVIASVGGVWSGVGGALVATGTSAAATTPKAGEGQTSAPPIPDAVTSHYPPGRAPTDAAGT